jgi:27-O-demethylrifamycin SV methyltransferase
MAAREALIAECARVLRPGGRLVLCDLIRHRDIPFQEVRARRGEFGTLRDAFGDARMDPLDSYLAMAKAHGLTIEVATDLTDATRPTFDRWRANVVQHRAELTGLLGEDGVQAFERSTDILEAFWRDGTLGYGLFAASKPG